MIAVYTKTDFDSIPREDKFMLALLFTELELMNIDAIAIGRSHSDLYSVAKLMSGRTEIRYNQDEFEFEDAPAFYMIVR